MSKKKKEWRAEKERLLSLGLEERRKQYGDNYLALDKIPTWRDPLNSPAPPGEKEQPVSLCDKVSLHKGDITILEVDAIVNAANSSLLGGGGVDGCIHRAAGHFLYDECHSLNGCETGKAKITCGYDLPAKYVIHTVGPIARGNVGNSQKEALKSCYKHSLKLMKDNNLRSVAFPCISTGIYGFPNEPAAEIAMRTVRDWLKENKDKVDRIIFCVFLDTDYVIYKRKMSDYFFPDKGEHEEGNAAQTNDGAEKKDPEDIAMLSQDPMKNDDIQDFEMMSQSQSQSQSQGEGDVDMVDVDTQSQEPETPTKENPAKEINTESQEPGSETENVTEEKTPPDTKPEPEKDQENSMGSPNQESQGLMESAETNDDPKHLDGSPQEPEQGSQTDSSQSKDDPDDKIEPIKK